MLGAFQSRRVHALRPWAPLVAWYLLVGCSLLNRTGPDVTCDDLQAGLVAGCAEGVIARCSDGQNVTFTVCDDADVCDAEWQVGPLYRCSEDETLPVVCGDGGLVPPEACDDGNFVDGDGCDSTCQPTGCGNGAVTDGEECDDGNLNDDDGCDSNCTPTGCGNDIVTTGEECDDGDLTDDDGCDSNCTPTGCGNDIVTTGEDCDAGVDTGDPVGHCAVGCVDNDVVQLSVGGSHTCVLLTSGAVKCFGYNSYGQLGYGNTTSIGIDETPAAVGAVDVGGGGVSQIAAGGNFTCVLLDDGTVKCWGDAARGQLGYGNTNDIGDDELPSSVGVVQLGGSVTQIAAGEDHVCARLSAGTVSCWGDGADGRLGYGNTNSIGDDELPSSVGPVSIGGTVEQIAAGAYHSCAVLSGGAVTCWGDGGSGRLGYGNTADIGDNELPSSVGTVQVGGSVTQIAAGGNHTCAVLSGGAAKCWGDGVWGKLGLGNTVNIGDDELPASVGAIDVGLDVIQLAVSRTDYILSGHTCALLSNGSVKCWGYGAQGRLGYGNVSSTGAGEVPSSLGTVPLAASVTAMASGNDHTCALRLDGAVSCWGHRGSGELGYGDLLFHCGDDEYPAWAGIVPILPYPAAAIAATRFLITSEDEPNGTQGFADTLRTGDAGWGGEIKPVADQDYFEITVAAGDSLTLRTTTLFDANACPGDTLIRLYDPNGMMLGEDDDDGLAGGCSLIDPTVDAFASNLGAGTHYIRVEEFGNDAPIDQYQLLVDVGQ